MKKLIEEYRLTEEQYEKLDKLIDLAIEYNSHTNITAIKTKEDFWEKHIEDSLELLKVSNMRNQKILDVGSGGGFPGLPIAIASSSSKLVLIDSNNKKIAFIKHAISELSLENVKVEYGRIEDYKNEWEEEFDVVTSRAVAPLNILLEITSFACNINGKVFLYKGANLEDEIPMEWSSIKPLGLEYERTYQYTLSDKVNRYILKFDKLNITNSKYPREYYKIKKDPIYN